MIVALRASLYILETCLKAQEMMIFLEHKTFKKIIETKSFREGL